MITFKTNPRYKTFSWVSRQDVCHNPKDGQGDKMGVYIKEEGGGQFLVYCTKVWQVEGLDWLCTHNICMDKKKTFCCQ